MIGRRRFLGASASLIGLRCAEALAQSKPRSAEKATSGKVKGSRRSSPSPDPLRADPQVNRLLAAVRDQHHLPGMIGAIVWGEDLAAIGAVGIRKIGSDKPIQVDDQVHLGSCTKAMTATLLGLLVDEELLTWDSTIRDVFPDLAKDLHAGFQAVTLMQLMTHRAGLPHDGPYWGLGRSGSTTEQRHAVLTRMLREAPASKPGTTYAYSNAGYVLAGLMAERVTGRSWEDLMRARLFEPLEMASAGFGPPGQPDQVDQPWGHRDEEGEVKPVRTDNPPVTGPACRVHASVPDWAKFASVHIRGAQGKSRLLEPATFRALHTPASGGEYAGGWFVYQRSWAGGKALMHKGSNLSWYATIWIAPARDLAFLVATNQGGDAAEAACEEANEALVRYAAVANPQAVPRRRRSGG